MILFLGWYASLEWFLRWPCCTSKGVLFFLRACTQRFKRACQTHSAGPGVVLPVKIINAAANVVEEARGTKLFPMRIEAADFSKFQNRECARFLGVYVCAYA